jgi:hypothetical protein
MRLDIVKDRLMADRELLQMEDTRNTDILKSLAVIQSIWDREWLIGKLEECMKGKEVIEKCGSAS